MASSHTFPAPPASSDAGLSIGVVSRATGIPPETLRTWETRYGFPSPERRPSGHRVYAESVVPRLTRMAEALALGHRASRVVGASDAELAQLLGGNDLATSDPQADRPAAVSRQHVSGLDTVALFDGDRLTRTLHADWARLGVLDFVEQRVAPLLKAVGDGWQTGRFDVRHEHFVSERVSDLLRAFRLPYDDRTRGPLVVLATLPGETHGLGLQMAALVIASAGGRIVQLGVDIPVREIARTAAEQHARAVGIGVSTSTAGTASARQLTRLRSMLDASVDLTVGGAGAPPTARAGIEPMRDFRALDGWVREMADDDRTTPR